MDPTFGLTETQGFLIVGLVAAAGGVASSVIAYRAARRTTEVSHQANEVSAAQGAIELAISGLTQVGSSQGLLIADLRRTNDDLTVKWERCELAKQEQAKRIDQQDEQITELLDRVAELEASR